MTTPAAKMLKLLERRHIMIVREILARSVLSKSRVSEYTVNTYGGCQHGCSYCYARFMKRYSGHREAWGEYVDVKINAPEILQKEISRKRPGDVWISGVCDPYQPLEKKYELTKRCVQLLIENGWPVTIQTRSPLVLRDIELLGSSSKVEVGMTITTSDDSIRRLFEPYAPSVRERIRAVGELHAAGIKTFVMIAPLLPKAENLTRLLIGKIDRVLVDRMNYNYADWVYRKYRLEESRSEAYFRRAGQEICSSFRRQGIECQVLY